MVTGKRTESIAADLKGIQPPHSHLSINLVPQVISYLITDVQSKKHIKKAQLTYEANELDEILGGLSSGEPFRSVSLTCQPFERTLVPAGLFRESHDRAYLDILFDLQQDVDVSHELMESIDCYLVYAQTTELKSVFISHFPNIRFHHGSRILLESMIRENRFEGHPHTLVYLEDKMVDIIMVTGKRPLFFNSFEVQNETDLCYHVLHSLEINNVDYQNAHISMAGKCSKNAPEFNLLKSYCPKLAMINFESTLAGLSHLTSDEMGQDAILMNQYQCAL